MVARRGGQVNAAVHSVDSDEVHGRYGAKERKKGEPLSAIVHRVSSRSAAKNTSVQTDVHLSGDEKRKRRRHKRMRAHSRGG